MIKAGGYADATEFAIIEWTPTFSTGVTTMGVGTTATGWYTNRAGIITGQFYVVFAGSPVFASTIAMDLPVTADADGYQAVCGSWIFRDQAPSLYHYSGELGIWSGANNSVSFSGAWDGTAPRTRVTNGTPFTVAATDILSGNLSYRAGA